MSVWQDISTAPKDGTVIDLWVVFPSGPVRWADARWVEAGEHSCSGPANWCSRENFPLHAFVEKPVATHWMPIPNPPEQQP
jgi:hypothetical protein